MKKAASPKNDEAAKICPLGTIQFCTGIAVIIQPKSASKIQIQLFSPPIGLTPYKAPFQTVPKVATLSMTKCV